MATLNPVTFKYGNTEVRLRHPPTHSRNCCPAHVSLATPAQHLAEAMTQYTAQFNEDVHRGESKEKQREDNYKNIVRSSSALASPCPTHSLAAAADAQAVTYYNVATDFYEYGWGQSFHFAPRCV
jgi:protein subunit release factor B